MGMTGVPGDCSHHSAAQDFRGKGLPADECGIPEI